METSRLFFGCDPGASGAVAVVTHDGAPHGWIAGDVTDRDLLDFLRVHLFGHVHPFAVLEEVGAKPRITPGGERVSMGAKSAFTFGGSYRALAMALTALGIPFDRVLPATWQAAMRCRTKGDKRVSKARAQELLPSERITHRNADAYLLAMYARQRARQITASGEENANATPRP